jgi:hypothetical protein
MPDDHSGQGSDADDAGYGRSMAAALESWLLPSLPQALEGTDRFVGADATVLDFWRWAFSDLRDNTQRGVLAEFLVALALGRTETRRKPWDNYDVTTASGLRVEVKASGYLQSWPRPTHSRLSFGRVIARTWDANTSEFGAEREVRADVFVFSVQTCKDPQCYDVLDISQWEFYVVAADRVRECAYKSVSIAWVRKHADPVPFRELAATIERVGHGSAISASA